jgi:hypothetical protein
MRRAAVLFIVLAGPVVTAGTGYAFDGQRRGFVLGFGVGPAIASYTQTASLEGFPDLTSDRESKGGLGTDFRIGGGVNEQFVLYYVNRVTWFSLDNALDETVTIASSVGLLGASYYLQPGSHTAYLVGLLGLSTWDAPFESDVDAQVGLGLGMGLGYEFSPHWSVEGNLNFGRPSDTIQGVEFSTNAFSFHATINVLAF